MLAFTLIRIQHIYNDKFAYLERSGNMMLAFNYINAGLASSQIGINCIKTNVDKIYTYLEMLTTHTMFPSLLPPSTSKEVLENINKVMEQHPCLALPNDLNVDIWCYYGLL